MDDQPTKEEKILNAPCTGKPQPCVFPDASAGNGAITYQHTPMVFFDSGNRSLATPTDTEHCTFTDLNSYF